MRSLLVALIVLCTGVSFGQLAIVDDFHRPPANDLSGSPPPYNWIKLSNQDTAVASFQINADSTVSGYNPLGTTHFGGVAWDSLVTDTSQAGIVVRQKGGNGVNTTLFIYFRMNNTDGNGGNGYRLRYFDDPAGTDQIVLQRVTSGVLSSDLASMSREIQPGDTLVVKVEADKTMKGLVYGANGVRDSIVVVDNAYNPSSWYWWLRAAVFSPAATFGDFMLGRIESPGGAPQITIGPPSLSFGPVAGGASATDTVLVSDTGSAPLHVKSAASSNPNFVVSPASGTISPSGSMKFAVTFTPTKAGPENGTLYFWHDADGSPSTIAVSGTGSGGTFLRPVITGISPASGPQGTLLTITGANFDPSPGNNLLRAGALRLVVASATTTNLTATVSQWQSYEPVTLEANALQSGFATPFDVTFGSSHALDAQSFGPPVSYHTDANPHVARLTDIDGDGKPDLVVLNGGTNSLGIYRNLASGDSVVAFAPPVTISTGSPYPTSYSSTLAIADFDNDGRVDVAVLDDNMNHVLLFRNTSTPGSVTFDPPVTIGTGLTPEAIAAYDIDGDGRCELLVASYGFQYLALYQNLSTPGSLAFSSPVTFPTASGPAAIAVGDLDGDGKPDVVVGTLLGGVSVFRNTSSPGAITTSSLSPRSDLNTLSGGFDVLLVDVDGDGKEDIVQVAGSLNIYRNQSDIGRLSFAADVDFALGASPYSAGCGDLDGDGKPDLAVVTQGNNTLSVFHNNATAGTITTASLGPRIDFATGIGPRFASVGEANGDGKPDLIVANEFDSTVQVYRNVLPILASCSVTPQTDTLAEVPVGTPRSDSLLVSNPGTAPLVISDISSDNPQFVVNPTAASVAAGDHRYIGITFTPTAVGMPASHIRFVHNGAGSPQIVTVVGRAVSATDTIVATTGGHGSISPAGGVVVSYDSSRSFSFLPDSGYHIDSLYLDGQPITPVASYTFYNVRANHALHVTFAINEFMLTPLAGLHGSILPALPVSVPFGGSLRFSIVPDSGWFVDSVFVDSNYAGDDTVYTFLNVAGDHLLRATFTREVLTFSLAANWNLVSLPLHMADTRTTVLFPSAVSPAFAYTGSYAPAETLHAGTGYWLRLSSAQSVTMLGKRRSRDSIVVRGGWNLIGAGSVKIAAGDVASDPPGLQTGRFFGYASGYAAADTLVPGYGYWVKVEADGALLLAPAGSQTLAAKIRIVPNGEQPPTPPGNNPAGKALPLAYGLSEPYPNPFNPSATIRYQLPADSRVHIVVYSILGEAVATLVDETVQAGYREVVWNASSVASGVYFCRMEALDVKSGDARFTEVRKLLVLK